MTSHENVSVWREEKKDEKGGGKKSAKLSCLPILFNLICVA